MALALIAGMGVFVALFRVFGARAIATLVLRAGWWLPVIVMLHTPQTFCSALAWRSLLPRPPMARLDQLYVYRWVRESVNSLLPVAQVGGEVARIRLLARSGTRLADASVSCVLDLTLELAAQVVFTLAAFGLLLGMVHDRTVERLAILATLTLAGSALGMLLLMRLAAADRLRGLMMRLGRRTGLVAGASYAGEPKPFARASNAQLVRSTLWHLLSWTFGGVETLAGLRALGLHVGVRQAMVVEGLSQIIRAAGFAVPGALGVQEGGLVLICGLFGIAPASAIALSLLRRVRELVLGLPGLLVWHRLEAVPRRL